MTGTSPQFELRRRQWSELGAFVLLASAILFAADGIVSAQTAGAAPESPRPLRKLDVAAPIRIAADATPTASEKTPIRRLSDTSTDGARPRSQAVTWGVMIAILAIAAGLSLWTRRSTGSGWGIPTGVLQVLGRSSVGNHSVVLVRLGDRLLLLSSASAGLETLTEITDPAEAAALTAECLAGRKPHLARIATPTTRSSTPSSDESVLRMSNGDGVTRRTVRSTAQEADHG